MSEVKTIIMTLENVSGKSSNDISDDVFKRRVLHGAHLKTCFVILTTFTEILAFSAKPEKSRKGFFCAGRELEYNLIKKKLIL